jgi:magnesium transporter
MSKPTNIGLSPGSLVYVGRNIEADETQIRIIKYNEQLYETQVLEKCDMQQLPTPTPGFVTWIDVDGIHDQQTIETVGQRYQIHSLALEDIMNTKQDAKLEFYDNQLFVVFKMFHLKKGQKVTLDTEHIALILGENYVVSFQEQRKIDIFTPIFERIEASVGKTRKNKADYLLFALMDLVVDNYMAIAEQIEEKLELLEGDILRNNHHDPITELYELKRELTQIRKHLWPLRDVLGRLSRDESNLIEASTRPYFRDVLDHIVQLTEGIVSSRELLTSLVDIHYSLISNRMNSVMKTLTIYSAIFMPLTFVVGIYGMNFDNMPELHNANGYYYIWGVMIALSIGLLIYFRKRGWL